MNMKLQDDYTPVALYARVSNDRQDVDLSGPAQLRALRDYAQKNGYLLAREYVDEAESWRIADRPEFHKMIDAATKPNAPFGEILVWKFSRFTHKRENAIAFKSMLRRKGVRVSIANTAIISLKCCRNHAWPCHKLGEACSLTTYGTEALE